MSRRTLEELGAVLAKEPGNLRAHYVAGLVHLYLGENASGARRSRVRRRARLERCLRAAYFYAQALLPRRIGSTTRSSGIAAPWSAIRTCAAATTARALCAAARGSQRRGEQDAGELRALRQQPARELAEIRYTRMGPKALALALGDDSAATAGTAQPEGPLFLPARAVSRTSRSNPARASPTADIDGDGDQDLLLANDSGTAVSALQQGDGSFALASDHPLAGITAVAAALWGRHRQRRPARRVSVPTRAQSALAPERARSVGGIAERSDSTNGGAQCRDGALFDADHDGDLDIFLVDRAAPDELLNNDLDGHFRPLAAERGLGGTGAGRGIVTADFDGDRDVDILVLQEQPPHELLLNDRLWQYREGEGFDTLRARDALAAVSGDADADGQNEIYLLTRAGRDRALAARRGPDLAAGHDLSAPAPPADSAQLALDDFSGDGVPELLVAKRRAGARAVVDAGKAAQVLFEAAGGEAGVIPVLLDVAQGPALVGLSTGAQPGIDLWRPGPGRFPFLALAFSGKDAQAESMRSNASGIGTRRVA